MWCRWHLHMHWLNQPTCIIKSLCLFDLHKSNCRIRGLTSLQWYHNGRDGVSNHQPPDCLLNRLLRRRSKKTSKLRVTGLCAGNSPGTGEFHAEMTSNAENVSIWWRHHVRGFNQSAISFLETVTIISLQRYEGGMVLETKTQLSCQIFLELFCLKIYNVAIYHRVPSSLVSTWYLW